MRKVKNIILSFITAATAILYNACATEEPDTELSTGPLIFLNPTVEIELVHDNYLSVSGNYVANYEIDIASNPYTNSGNAIDYENFQISFCYDISCYIWSQTVYTDFYLCIGEYCTADSTSETSQTNTTATAQSFFLKVKGEEVEPEDRCHVRIAGSVSCDVNEGAYTTDSEISENIDVTVSD